MAPSCAISGAPSARVDLIVPVVLTAVVIVGEVHGERNLIKVVKLHGLHVFALGAASLDADWRLAVPFAVFVSKFRPVFRSWITQRYKHD